MENLDLWVISRVCSQALDNTGTRRMTFGLISFLLRKGCALSLCYQENALMTLGSRIAERLSACLVGQTVTWFLMCLELD